MNDIIALGVIHTSACEAHSARPDAPVFDDVTDLGRNGRRLRRSFAEGLRRTATLERRLADQLDPATRTRTSIATSG